MTIDLTGGLQPEQAYGTIERSYPADKMTQ